MNFLIFQVKRLQFQNMFCIRLFYVNYTVHNILSRKNVFVFYLFSIICINVWL